MSNQNVETPQWFIDGLRDVVGLNFMYDMAASHENMKAENYFTEEDNSLAIDWPIDGLCWVNPPFCDLPKWFATYKEQAHKGAKIVAICPLSSDLYTQYSWQQGIVCPIVGRIWKREVRSCMLTFWNVPMPKLLRVDRRNEKVEWIW